jgi:hypothetical protein
VDDYRPEKTRVFLLHEIVRANFIPSLQAMAAEVANSTSLPHMGSARVCGYSTQDGLQMTFFCASDAHLPGCKLRFGSRKTPFSAHPELNPHGP